ncbi:MAG TPA: DUF2142 domain-containing protein [Thermoanaerobaculia bacterium]|nr:DUF2142 domain-containing protein [Thermoanaerobaculia bacterium]
MAEPDRAAPPAPLLTPARLLAATCGIAGTVLCFLTPPFMVADEPAHFFRASALSRGQLGALERPDGAGAVLPASLGELVDELWTGMPGHPERKVDPRAIRRLLERPLEPQRTAFRDFRTAAQYPFVPYLPQAAGLALGRLAGATPLAGFYLARLANLLAGTLLLLLAVRQLPACRWFAAMAATTPMALTTLASVSADVATLGAAFVLIATTAKLALAPAAAIRRRDAALLLAAAVLLCLTKLTYAPLALAPAILPRERRPRGPRGRAFAAAYVAAVALASAASLATVLSLDLSIRPGSAADRAAQLRAAAREPLRVAGVVAADAIEHGPRYAAQLVGVQLGWLDTRLPWWLVEAYLALLLALLALDGAPRPSLRLGQRAGLAALAAAAVAATIASQYMTFTPFRADFVEGVQGRYFLPLLPAAGLALHRPRRGGPPAALPWLLAAWTALAVAVTLRAIVHRYYG